MIWKLASTLFKAQPATFTGAMSVNEAERLLSKKISPLLRQSVISDGLIGQAKRDAVVIYRYKPFGRFGGLPGAMTFRGKLKNDNGSTCLEGQFQLSALGRIFAALWLFFGTLIGGWLIARYFFVNATEEPSTMNEAVIATVVLFVGFIFLFLTSRRLEKDIKIISASIIETFRE